MKKNKISNWYDLENYVCECRTNNDDIEEDCCDNEDCELINYAIIGYYLDGSENRIYLNDIMRINNPSQLL